VYARLRGRKLVLGNGLVAWLAGPRKSRHRSRLVLRDCSKSMYAKLRGRKLKKSGPEGRLALSVAKARNLA
jgi:hypothetical protein